MAAMPIRTRKWPAGVPCWADLTVPDVPAAQAFYAAVLGWSFTDTADEYGGYVIGQVDGAAAAGIGPTPQQGVPSAWTLYLAFGLVVVFWIVRNLTVGEALAP